MKIGEKLKKARTNKSLTQEQVAEEIAVSRQTISNWETEKSYPDIISVIKLSDLYQISLDELLKGDNDLIHHINESTDTVQSNKQLMSAIAVNILLLIILIIFSGIIGTNKYLMLVSSTVSMVATGALFYQIIRKF